MRKRTLPIRPILLVAAPAGWVLPASPAHAQAKVPVDARDQEIQLLKSEIKLLENRVGTLEGLDQKVKVIDRKLEVQEEVQQQKALEMPIIKASDQGFTFSSPPHNGDMPDYKINVGGILQGDGRFFTSGRDKNVGSTFFLNRVRPILTGTVGKYYDFNITPDFGQGRVVLQDAYLNMTYFKEAQIQDGKYKAPLALERLQSDRDLEFSERSEIQNMVPNRDTGIEIHSDSLFDNRLTYQVALMNGVPNNTATGDSDFNDGKDFGGRIFATPFKLSERDWLKGLGFGFAGSYRDEPTGTTPASHPNSIATPLSPHNP